MPVLGSFASGDISNSNLVKGNLTICHVGDGLNHTSHCSLSLCLHLSLSLHPCCIHLQVFNEEMAPIKVAAFTVKREREGTERDKKGGVGGRAGGDGRKNTSQEKWARWVAVNHGGGKEQTKRGNKDDTGWRKKKRQRWLGLGKCFHVDERCFLPSCLSPSLMRHRGKGG